MKNDKAKTSISSISRHGLLEISRQRISAPVEQGTYAPCAHCGGTGRMRSKESMSLIILRNIQMRIAKGGIATVEGEVSIEIADLLLNRKREEIMKMEKVHNVRILLNGKPGLFNYQYHLDFLAREETPEPDLDQPIEPDRTDSGNQQNGSKAAPKAKPRKKPVRRTPRKKKASPQHHPPTAPSSNSG
jgi:hypothetical protein